MILTHALELGVVLGDLGHVEERDEWLIGGSDQQELQGVVVERDALESGEDRMQSGSASD